MNWTIQRLALAAALGLTLAACGGDSGSDGGPTPQPNEPEEPETPVDPEPEPEPTVLERVRFLTADGLVIIGQGDVPLGDGFFPVAETILRQNVPNPFNPETVIPFELADVGLVRLTVYSTLGQEVRTLVDEVRSAGRHRVRWDGRDERGRRVGAGLFLYRLTVNGLAGSSRYPAVPKAHWRK